MRTVVGPVGPEGALVEGFVSLPTAQIQTIRQAGLAVPQPLPVRALLDIGAEISCLDSSVIQALVALGLEVESLTMANAPALRGIHFTSQYAVDWAIAHQSADARKSLVCRNLAVLEQPLGQLGYQALLGRDVLARCLLIYDGPSARFTLGY